MFTGKSLRLSQIVSDLGTDGIEVIRDCDFSYIGKIPSNISNRIVPCGSKRNISDALEYDDIAGLIVTPDLVNNAPDTLGLAVSETPIASAYALHETLCRKLGFLWDSFPTEIHPSATVHPSAIISDNDVKIGPDTVIHPGAIILPRTIIGARCAIGPGTVVGTDAFEVNTYCEPQRILEQAGGVWISDDVEIQAKCTIVRATFGGFTFIGQASKMDCQVHLAHDCKVGNRVRIAACAELSGRVNVEDDVFIGPNCSISNGISIHEGAQITLGAVVIRDVGEGQKVSGNFAIQHSKLIRRFRELEA